MKEIKNMTFEESYEELVDITEKMQNDDLDLDSSMEYFERGVGLYHQASKKLSDSKEKVIKILNEQGDFDEYEG